MAQQNRQRRRQQLKCSVWRFVPPPPMTHLRSPPLWLKAPHEQRLAWFPLSSAMSRGGRVQVRRRTFARHKFWRRTKVRRRQSGSGGLAERELCHCVRGAFSSLATRANWLPPLALRANGHWLRRRCNGADATSEKRRLLRDVTRLLARARSLNSLPLVSRRVHSLTRWKS